MLVATTLLQIHNFCMKNSQAYTLIEVLVTLTIVALLFSVGYANFRAFTQRQAVLNTVKTIQGDLRLAQQIALSGQKPDDVSCNSPALLNGYNFTILTSSSYEIRASCTGGNVTQAFKTVTLPDNVSIASPFPSPNPILFKVLGTGTNIPSGQNAVITLSQTGTTNQVTIPIGSGGQIQ